MRLAAVLLVGVFCVGSQAAAQVRGCMFEHHALPDELRSSLEERLSAFVAAQAEGRWEDVAEFLGTNGFVYKGSYRHCLVERMKEIRMSDFDFSIQNLSTCTTERELPAGTVDRVAAEQLSWYLGGTGEFQTSSETWTQQTKVVAYRHQGQWYFTPPQQTMQDKWEKVHYTEADFVRDRKEEIEIRNSPSSPIEISDVHVHMDRQFPSRRNIDFRLRNNSVKKVIWLSMAITIAGQPGGVYWSGPYVIKPRGYLAHEYSVSAYGDVCGGVWKHAMIIQEVHFADGSEWKVKQSGNHKDN
ncbi:MAG: hypothetical protein WCA92_13660 [Terriglobales bacterium]